MSRQAFITFQFDGVTYEYDGGLPLALQSRISHLQDAKGYWLGGFPRALETSGADEEDELPIARWEIEHIGGTVLEIHGARENGAIHLDDWKRPRIY